MKAFSMTDVGKKRLVNQDYVYTRQEPVGNIPNLFVVADGMGGHKAGDFASKYTTEVLAREIEKSEKLGPQPIIMDAIQIANHRLIEAAGKDIKLKGMGTTLVAATIIEHTLYFANIGDSRLYIINDKIRQLSKDHSLVEEMVRLGESMKKRQNTIRIKISLPGPLGQRTCGTGFFEYRLSRGDIILMCTDGLSNMLEDEEIYRIVQGRRDIVEAVEYLIDAANENGGKDNIGIVLVEPFADEVSK